MTDVVETLQNGSIIQHGKHNDRVYILKCKNNPVETIQTVQELATLNNYSKIVAKVPEKYIPTFLGYGYTQEATITKFYENSEAVCFMSKFLNSDRIMNIETDLLLEFAHFLQNEYSLSERSINPEYSLEMLSHNDVESIVSVFSQVFDSYPFPIFNIDYIAQTMRENVKYFGVKNKGKLVAVSSAEIDIEAGNAEMTDFATLPGFLGNGFANHLLRKMEKHMKERNVYTVYTIARLHSIPMNITF